MHRLLPQVYVERDGAQRGEGGVAEELARQTAVVRAPEEEGKEGHAAVDEKGWVGLDGRVSSEVLRRIKTGCGLGLGCG